MTFIAFSKKTWSCSRALYLKYHQFDKIYTIQSSSHSLFSFFNVELTAEQTLLPTEQWDFQVWQQKSPATIMLDLTLGDLTCF